jgi:Rieske Fe-S protein
MNLFKDKLSRRKFFRRLVYGLLSLQVVYIFVNLLKTGKINGKQAKLFEAGELSFFENGKVYPFGSGHFYLSRLNDGGFLAISTKCTHMGCTVKYYNQPHQFECPCHGSAFNNKGEVLSPPATRALDYFPVIIKEKKVFVDTSNPQRRNRHDHSQVIYA